MSGGIAPVRASCRENENRDSRQGGERFQPFSEFPAIHHGHEEIEENGRWCAVLLDVGQRLPAVGDSRNLVPGLLEDILERIADFGVVVHHQNERVS